MAELAAALASRGHEAILVTGRPSYPEARRLPAPSRERCGGVTIHRVPTLPRREGKLGRGLHYLSFASSALLRALTLPRPDVVLAFSSTPFFGGPAAALLAAAKRCPLVYCVQDVHPEISVALGALREGSLVRWMRRFETITWRAAARVIVIADDLAEGAASRGVDAARLVTVRNWADPSHITPGSGSVLRDRLGFAPDDFVVQYAGNFGRAQDLETVLEAARLAGRKDGRVKLLLVGAGSGQGSIERRALRVPGAVVVPFQPEAQVSDVLAAADLALVPLHRGLTRWCVPSKIYSILASGRPVGAILDAGSEVARVVESADCGFRVDPGDVAGLARHILDLASDRARATRYGANARRWLEHEATLARAVSEYEAVLAAACSAAASSPPDAAKPPPDTSTGPAPSRPRPLTPTKGEMPAGRETGAIDVAVEG